ncbi:MAG: hypothetical protein WCE82_10565 [Halobacteriota archaeon]
MRGKKVLAMFLIALIATTVVAATSVVTTEKAAAQPVDPIILYKLGMTYFFGPSQFNEHSAASVSLPPGARDSATSAGGLVYASIITTAQISGSQALTGISWQLNLAGADWSTVQGKTCTITVTMVYLLQAKSDYSTRASVQWIAAGNQQDIVRGNSQHTQS